MRSIVTTEIAEKVGEVGRWFVGQQQDLIDFIRADTIHSARLQGFSWREACEFAAEYLGPTAAGNAGHEAMMKSWTRFNSKGDAEWGRFYLANGLGGEFQPSPDHAAAVREKFVARVKATGRYVERPVGGRLLDPRTDSLNILYPSAPHERGT